MNQTSRSFRWEMAVASILSLFAMAYVDYITGYEIIVSAAYLVPVFLCAWYLGKREIWLMSFATGVASWLADRLTGHVYSHAPIQYWNGFSCFLISLVTGLLLKRLKHTLEERTRMNEVLKQALSDLNHSTEEIRKLQDSLQVVCAWTKRIKVGDEWMTADEFLSSQLHLKLTHGISPEARDVIEEEINRDIDDSGRKP